MKADPVTAEDPGPTADPKMANSMDHRKAGIAPAHVTDSVTSAGTADSTCHRKQSNT